VSVRLALWAPDVADLTVWVAGREIPTVADPDRPGWRLAAETLPHGTDYRLRVAGTTVGDPQARWAPQGVVGGPSRVFDPATLVWHDQEWAGRALDAASVVYELHVGTFTPGGTLDAAASRLAHLVDLGVTHVELMPLASFDSDHGWGYEGVGLNAVHEPYGGPTALARFVDAAHAAGLAVWLDVVYNHLGPRGNVWPVFGPFFTDRYSTPWGEAVNLDGPGSEGVREVLLASARGWLADFHLDGLRLDAVHELHDASHPPFLVELADAVHALGAQLGRPLVLVAESDRNDPSTVTPTASGGLGMDAQWDDDVHHALHWLLTGERQGYYADFAGCAAAAAALGGAFLHDGRWSSFRGTRHGHPVDFAVTPPWRFVVALQTHDQVGNRAAGERLGQLVGRDTLAAGALLLAALPYTPMLFMGEEWGATTPWQFFTSYSDPELAHAVSQGRRAEFATHGWGDGEVPDPQDPATWRRSRLDWGERLAGEELLRWYRDVLAWRAATPVPDAAPSLWWAAPDGGHPWWWAVQRGADLALVSLAGGVCPVDVAAPAGQLAVRLAFGPAVTLAVGEGGHTRVTLPAGASVVLSARGAPVTPVTPVA